MARRRSYWWYALAYLALSALSIDAAAQCDPAFVTVANGIVRVSPNGIDDTDTIQCAFDEAQRSRLSRVQLTAGEFFVRELEIEDFRGVFQGASQSASTLTWLTEALDCEALQQETRSLEMIRFRRGRPTVWYMTIAGADACALRNFFDRTLIRASGSRVPNCQAENVSLTVDRTTFTSDEDRRQTSAIRVASVSRCSPLTGSVSVRYSTFSRVSGVGSELQGYSPVDVRFNRFKFSRVGVSVGERSQDVSIVGNRFSMNLFTGDGRGNSASGTGVFVRDDPRNAEDLRQTIRIANNTFFANNAGRAVRVEWVDARSYVADERRSIEITDNYFEGNINRSYWGDRYLRFLVLRGGANGYVAGNTVVGDLPNVSGVPLVVDALDYDVSNSIKNWIFTENDLGGGVVSWQLGKGGLGEGNLFTPDQNGFLCIDQALELCSPELI